MGTAQLVNYNNNIYIKGELNVIFLKHNIKYNLAKFYGRQNVIDAFL